MYYVLCTTTKSDQNIEVDRFARSTPTNYTPWPWKLFFTREYTKCTAGSTFCFVVVVVVLGKPYIKLASFSADS
jgi:hypothetical protein